MDEAEYEKHLSELHRELSGFEESGHVPRVELQARNVDFGRILYVCCIQMERDPVNDVILSYERTVEKKILLKNDSDVTEHDNHHVLH